MPDGSGQTALSGGVLASLLDAIDAALLDVMHGHYGGGIVAVLSSGGKVMAEQSSRPIPAGAADAIVVELIRPDAKSQQSAPLDHGTGLAATPIGSVDLNPPPDARAGDVDVILEIFDERDPNEPTDNGRLATGWLLARSPEGQAGQMPGHGLAVVRSDDAIDARDQALSQGQRGWLSLQPRKKVNRGGGLGSNGHRRATPCSLIHPVSRELLCRIGDRVAQVVADDVARDGGLGPIERLHVGLRTGDAIKL